MGSFQAGGFMLVFNAALNAGLKCVSLQGTPNCRITGMFRQCSLTTAFLSPRDIAQGAILSQSNEAYYLYFISLEARPMGRTQHNQMSQMRAKYSLEDLEKLATTYRVQKGLLQTIKSILFPRGQLIQVKHSRYVGLGTVVNDLDCPSDKVAVKLSNNNVWYYPVESCRPITTNTEKTV